MRGRSPTTRKACAGAWRCWPERTRRCCGRLRRQLPLSPGAERLLGVTRRSGLQTLLVTGGFGFFARTLQGQLGIDRAWGQRSAGT